MTKLNENGALKSASGMAQTMVSKHSISISKDKISANGWGLIVVAILVLGGFVVAVF